MILLASYPRSGNTMLRMILWQCLGMPSTSIYPHDLGGNRELECRVGHVAPDRDGVVRCRGSVPLLVKTHQPVAQHGTEPAVYVVRSPRPALVSLWRFWGRSVVLADIVAGRHRFGRISQHVSAWTRRPDTSILRYETMVNETPRVVEQLASWFGVPVLRSDLPGRDVVADGRWIKPASDWREAWTADAEAALHEQNAEGLDFGPPPW